MIGPGKYDDICTSAREQAQASGAILIIVDGKLGSGFACQTDLKTLLMLPELLRELADQIEKDRATATS